MSKLSTFVILGLLTVVFTGCASFNLEPEKPATTPRVERAGQKTPPVTKSTSSTTAVWYLFAEGQVTLYLKNLDDGMAASMIIQKGLTALPLEKGHWELTGFEEDGNSFTSMNTSKKFVFRVRPGTNVYAGSIVIGCPKVPSSEFKYLKAMRYFDRYPFSSSEKLCEMIVGNDFAFVRNQLRKLRKNKKLKLIMGF